MSHQLRGLDEAAQAFARCSNPAARGERRSRSGATLAEEHHPPPPRQLAARASERCGFRACFESGPRAYSRPLDFQRRSNPFTNRSHHEQPSSSPRRPSMYWTRKPSTRSRVERRPDQPVSAARDFAPIPRTPNSRTLKPGRLRRLRGLELAGSVGETPAESQRIRRSRAAGCSNRKVRQSRKNLGSKPGPRYR